MLLCGSFQNQVIRLINMLRFDEKLLSREKNSAAEKLVDSNSDFLTQFELEDSEDPNIDFIPKEEEEAESDDDVENLTGETEVGAGKKKDWRRVRKNYERSKQYIFIAATLPENGKRTAGGVLKRMFPDASWVSGSYLHRHNPRYRLTTSPLFLSFFLSSLFCWTTLQPCSLLSFFLSAFPSPYLLDKLTILLF